MPLCKVHLVSAPPDGLRELVSRGLVRHKCEHPPICYQVWKEKSSHHPEFELYEDWHEVTQLLKGQTGTWEPSIQSAWCVDLHCPLAIQGAPQGPGVLASLGSFTEVQNFRLSPRPTDQDLPFHKLLR